MKKNAETCNKKRKETKTFEERLLGVFDKAGEMNNEELEEELKTPEQKKSKTKKTKRIKEESESESESESEEEDPVNKKKHMKKKKAVRN